MTSLSILPIEILEWVTSVVNTSQQTRLWQCGDRILNIKLKNGGLKRTSLCWPGWSWMPWPRWYFTTFDGIVDVEWGLSIGTSLCPTLDLNLLPKTLKRLDLACDDVFIVLRQQYVNMHDILPTLESLRLSGSRLCEENLKNLPSNLIELRVTSEDGTIRSPNIFGDLPRHIVRLTLGFSIVDQSEHENDLPSHLISLKLKGLWCNFGWFSKLPKSLKILKMKYGGLDDNWLLRLPQLERLAIDCPKLRFRKSDLHQLPQSLKTLEVYQIDDLTFHDEFGPLLPRNLTRLKLERGVGHAGLQQLPASLTDFDLVVNTRHPDILSFYSPDAIRIHTTSLNLKLFPFPTKLQYLELGRISDDMCAMLPPGLRSLRINRGLMTKKGASKLPKSLTYLRSYFDVFNENETISYLGHISELAFDVTDTKRNKRNKLNEKWIWSLLPSSSSSSTCSSPEYVSDDTCTDINNHLTSLSVYSRLGIICPLIEKSFFDALPKFTNLKKLWIYNDDIPCDWLCLVPQNVTDLYMRNLTAYPTAAQLSMLPKCLTYLNLQLGHGFPRECDWKEDLLMSLPRTLQVFYMDGSKIKLTHRVQ